MTIKTIFLDRDGVINKDTKYVYRIRDFQFIPGIFDACKYFLEIDYQIIVITNQSGIGRGYYNKRDFKDINSWMISEFNKNDINILDVFYCPHLPEDCCDCRKPKPGMFFLAKNKYNIDMKNSWVIGDSERDIKAANLAGIEKTILLSRASEANQTTSDAAFFLNSLKEISTIIF